MKTKTGMSIGLALTLVVGVFATMLALGVFTPNEARAQEATKVSPGALTFNATEVDAPTTVMVQFNTSPVIAAQPNNNPPILASDGGIVEVGGKIYIEFPATAIVPSGITVNDVTLAYTGVTTEPPENVEVSGQTVELTVNAEIPAGDAVTVDFLAAAGIITPVEEIAHTVKVSTSTDTVAVDSTPISGALSYTATSAAGIRGLAVKHSPDGAGAAARVQVDFYIKNGLTADVGTITIEFNDDVQVPASFSESSISIIGNEPRVAMNPADVFVKFIGTPSDEPEITLTVPDMDAVADMVGGLDPGLVSVLFRQSAGIKNPTGAGTWKVKVKTSADAQVESLDSASRSLVTLRQLSLNNKSGKRGVTATASGSGFKNDTTATVWLEKTGDNVQGSGEPTLCTAVIAKSDTFTCDFLIGAEFDGSDTNYIHAKDGELKTAVKAQPWSISPQIKVVPRSAAIGDKVTIQVRDFGDKDLGEVEFTLGGELVDTETPTSSGGSADITGTIPDETAIGVQTLAAWPDDGRTKSITTTTMTVLGAQVEVSPSTVVPNQSVTITGRGFSSRKTISQPAEGLANIRDDDSIINQSEILIGGTPIMEWGKINGGEPIGTNSGGSWVAEIVIPVTATTTAPGTYELKIIDSEGRPGVASITIPKRTVTFDPPESRVGTTLTVSGTGWIASNGASDAEDADIELRYESDNGETSSRATPDANGDFTATIKVPLNADIPSTNSVVIEYTPDDTDNVSKVSETVAHRVPGAGITLTPSSGPGGTLVTMTGDGFKAFTSLDKVYIGNLTITPRPAGASVGRGGVLENVQLLIPALDPGTHTIRAEVGGEQGAVVSAPFTITDEDAPLASTGDQSPADAFKVLIDSGNLLTVYWFDAENQAYLSYDPDPANAGFNNLDTVSGGKAYWVRLTADSTFLGKTLLRRVVPGGTTLKQSQTQDLRPNRP